MAKWDYLNTLIFNRCTQYYFFSGCFNRKFISVDKINLVFKANKLLHSSHVLIIFLNFKIRLRKGYLEFILKRIDGAGFVGTDCFRELSISSEMVISSILLYIPEYFAMCLVADCVAGCVFNDSVSKYQIECRSDITLVLEKVIKFTVGIFENTMLFLLV